MADTKDHVYPQSVSVRKNDRGEDYVETVNACFECNALMTDEFAYDLKFRVKNLIQKLMKKYKLNHIMPDWDESELQELGSTLQQKVRHKVRVRELAMRRVLHVQGVLYSLDKDENNGR